jgi:hypothetical protein
VSDWEVFARSELNIPIRHVGTVAAERPDDADVFAWKLYDEWSWKEMFVVPRSELVRILPAGAAPISLGGKQLVFGREAAGDLLQLGEIEAGEGAIEAAAISRYGVQWTQMTLIPAATIRWVAGPAVQTARR